MTPQELKNSIIQLAMRGGLVEQRPEEGTAEELYHLIQLDKKSKGINNRKKMEPITEDIIPYDIPDNWRWVMFGDIVDYNMGKTPPRAEAEWWKPEHSWVSIADMPENGHITSTKECVSMNAIEKKFGNKVSQAGTMIMSFKLTVGRVSILDIDAVHNEAIISIYPFCDDDKVIQSYLFKLLPLVTQYGNTKNAIKGKTLNDTSIYNLLIPLPPLAEQKRIVAKIEELLPYIDRYEQAWSELEDFNKRFPDDMQKSILQTAIQGKLVEQCPEEGTGEELFQQLQAEKKLLLKAGKIKKEKSLPKIAEDEKPFDLPESWKWVRFGETSQLLDGIKMEGRSYPYLEAKYLRGNAEAKYLNSGKFIAKGTRTILVDGENSGEVFNIQEDGYIGSTFKVLYTSGVLVSDYVLYFLLLYKTHYRNNKKGAAIPHLNKNLFFSMPFPLPPLAEQKRIVAKLEEILPLCEKLK